MGRNEDAVPAAVEGVNMAENKDISYAVYRKMHRSVYNPEPAWEVASPWHECAEDLRRVYAALKNDPRCEAVKVVRRTVVYEEAEL